MKKIVKKRKKAYLTWLQQKSSEAKEEYQWAKRESKIVLRKAQNED